MSESGVFIGLGGNLPSAAGSPRATCEAALGRLAARGIVPRRLSSWYLTEPVPRSDQPWFVNAVAEIETTLDPAGLLAFLHEIETAFGRTRRQPNDPRTLDLDLLAYGDLLRDLTPILPHPRLHERAFVLTPLAEIAPRWRHPRLGRTASQLLEDLSPGQEVALADNKA